MATKHTAGAFDIRTFIGALIGIYGVVLTITGLIDFSEYDSAKTGGVNANLWAGLVMVAVAIFFIVWARVRPIIVDEETLAAAKDDDRSVTTH